MASRLISLPQELVDSIVNWVPVGPPLICLALSCSYFLRLTAPMVSQAIVNIEAPWAGHRLITVGDSATEMPPCLDEEVTRIAIARGMAVNHRDAVDAVGRDYYEEFVKNLLYNMKVGKAQFWRDESMLQYQCRRLPRTGKRKRSGFGREPSTQLTRPGLLHRLNPDEIELLDRFVFFPASDAQSPGVLRCLDLKEYVRDDFVASSAYAYSLGEVLCCFMQWTAQGEGNRGRWAGRTFDIRAQDQVDETWEDVSAEAVRLLEANHMRATDLWSTLRGRAPARCFVNAMHKGLVD
ncbi:hypothetical protein LTR56_011059 [Elasticomyces elasticus]|nr:hypothetical protein LTR56_011059 [Elasticomyces elasticus]KAK3655026.1 hypothetical protein LTR22_010494 [Elasticomyces elasticus]KAK4914071.1 hypothetical protein LTR49_017688 [Elasticomyces elasticus]KAK5757448.1 hypothetical protein LTS12_012405 [Elasticomyces elasticus]